MGYNIGILVYWHNSRTVNHHRKKSMAKIITLANQKGGTGKTTTAVNLGAALAETGKRVLLVDLDPQGNLSINLGIDIDKRKLFSVEGWCRCVRSTTPSTVEETKRCRLCRHLFRTQWSMNMTLFLSIALQASACSP